MTTPFELLPLDAAIEPDAGFPGAGLSELSRAVQRVDMPPPPEIERLAMDMVLRGHDPRAVLADYGIDEVDFPVIAASPLYVSAHRQAVEAIKEDPNYRTRLLARAALEKSVQPLADIVGSRIVDTKDRINAVKALQGLAAASDTGAGGAARKAGSGVSIAINFGQAVGRQLGQVIRVEADQ